MPLILERSFTRRKGNLVIRRNWRFSQAIERLDFTILPVPNPLIFQAVEYKAEYSISFADCFALASAIEYKATLVTGDPEFKKVEHLVEIVWLS